MLIKLHKQDEIGHDYWEGWVAGNDAIFHWGTVGDKGERHVLSAESEAEAEELLQTEAAAKETSGFSVIERDAMSGIVLSYRLVSWGNEEDLETRYYLEDLCDQALGWTGNGNCDGGEIGSGIMNIWCLVLNVPAAIKILAAELETHAVTKGAVIASYDEASSNHLIVWPDEQANQVLTM